MFLRVRHSCSCASHDGKLGQLSHKHPRTFGHVANSQCVWFGKFNFQLVAARRAQRRPAHVLYIKPGKPPRTPDSSSSPPFPFQSSALALASQSAMAASLRSFATLRNPNPGPNLYCSRVPQAFCRLSFSSFLQLEAVPPCGLGLAQSSLSMRSPGFRLIAVERRVSRAVAFAASNEESVSRS